MTQATGFRDRTDAGRQLANAMSDYRGQDDVMVFGLPRGGVPVAYEVAEELNAPLDVLVVRKLGVPGQRELAMGAIASGGVTYVDEELVRRLHIGQEEIDRIASEEREELEAREAKFHGGDSLARVAGATAIVVDDGIATGATMRASLRALREMSPERIIVAVPLASATACSEMEAIADEVICLSTPQPFSAVGVWYEDFKQTTDEDVRQLLEKSRED